jgi:uncharacterized membrane protein HdeD (DUF308 family)
MKLTFDKKLHLAFGTFISMLGLLIMKDFGFSQNVAVATGAIFAFVAGVIKEIYDYFSKTGNYERADIFYTTYGVIFMLIYEFVKNMI